MGKKLDESFWTNRYKEGSTGWDIGYPSTPLKEFMEGLEDRNMKILIPGAGNAYEAEYLWKQGFKNVFIVDLSAIPLKSFEERVPDFPKDQLLHLDFFDLDESFELILEQTFYCALLPGLRDRYVEKMHELITPGGHLAGVLFSFPLTESGPPFGGSLEEYRKRFQDQFKIKVMEPCRNSIPQRAGNEVFMLLERT